MSKQPKPGFTSPALGVVLTLATATGAFAQSTGASAGAPAGGGADPRSNYVTSTGATVPHPGASQSGGTTSLDVGVQHQDDKIQGSICKGC